MDYLKKNAQDKGYYFNRDASFVNELLKSLLVNLKRYGYASCPCRLSTGNYDLDSDLICPCVYMEDDVKKYGSCFCALYISKDVCDGKKQVASIPESRPKDKLFGRDYADTNSKITAEKKWKCEVCGYEHSGSGPPSSCPKCGASKEMFKEMK
jgi:ferredoxin-thioredoxin reductase catalytic subunit/rubredoxin